MFNKTLAIKTETYFEKIAHHDQVGYTPKMQVWFNILKSINVFKKIKDKKHTIISIDAKKKSLIKSNSLCDKAYRECRSIPKHKKIYI